MFRRGVGSVWFRAPTIADLPTLPTSTTLTEPSSSLYLPIGWRETSELDTPRHDELAHFPDERLFLVLITAPPVWALRRSIESTQYVSICSIGDSYDNALAQTINGLYKAEVIWRRGPWRSFEPSSMPPWNGSTGSTTAGFWRQSETSRRRRGRLLSGTGGTRQRSCLTQNNQPPRKSGRFRPWWAQLLPVVGSGPVLQQCPGRA